MSWMKVVNDILYSNISKIVRPTTMDWMSVSITIGSKTARQCYDHYQLMSSQAGISAKCAKYFYTEQEKNLILSFDKKKYFWREFQKEFFPNHTQSQLKN